MARRLNLGFELDSSLEFDAYTVQAWSHTWITGRGGSGTLALQTTSNNSGGSNNATWTKNVPGSLTEWYARILFRSDSGTSSVIRRLTFSGASATQLGLNFGGVGTTVAGINGSGSTIATTSGVIQAGYNLLEIHFKLATGTSGIYECKLNGVTENSVSGINTNPAAAGGLASINHTAVVGSYSTTFDDIAINDLSGSYQNSWVGDGYIRMAKPNADGDSSQWVGSDGNSTNNYALVDEGAPNSDTDYVQSATSGDKDLYNLETYTLAAGEEIRLVQPLVYAKRVPLDTPLTLEVGIKSGSTEAWDVGHSLGTSYGLYYGDVYDNNPDDNAQFQQSDLDSLQVGIRHA